MTLSGGRCQNIGRGWQKTIKKRLCQDMELKKDYQKKTIEKWLSKKTKKKDYMLLFLYSKFNRVKLTNKLLIHV